MNSAHAIPADAPMRLTAKQLSKLLGCSVQTVHRWGEEGVLPPPLRFGPRVVRWDRDTLRESLRRQEEAAGEASARLVEQVV